MRLFKNKEDEGHLPVRCGSSDTNKDRSTSTVNRGFKLFQKRQEVLSVVFSTTALCARVFLIESNERPMREVEYLAPTPILCSKSENQERDTKKETYNIDAVKPIRL